MRRSQHFHARSHGKLHRAVALGHQPAQTKEEFDANATRIEKFAADDDRYYAKMTRAYVIPHRSWLIANERRHQMRLLWDRFFEDWDVLLCPAAASAAFPHDQVGERHERTIEVNGKRVPPRINCSGRDIRAISICHRPWRRLASRRRACHRACRSSHGNMGITPRALCRIAGKGICGFCSAAGVLTECGVLHWLILRQSAT